MVNPVGYVDGCHRIKSFSQYLPMDNSCPNRKQRKPANEPKVDKADNPGPSDVPETKNEEVSGGFTPVLGRKGKAVVTTPVQTPNPYEALAHNEGEKGELDGQSLEAPVAQDPVDTNTESQVEMDIEKENKRKRETGKDDRTGEQADHTQGQEVADSGAGGSMAGGKNPARQPVTKPSRQSRKEKLIIKESRREQAFNPTVENEDHNLERFRAWKPE
ncbi:hypothetical protein R1sor_011424 [Riccia sorocarpa]|uniref:Uncharacterized protein n=1 Tax=Riccia sorocarpa TaxID=122646 RepID=A0ABD3I0V6_9MARC